MSTIEKSIDVDVPVRTAYNQWTQFEEFPEFMEHVDHIRQLDDKTVRWQVSIGDVKREFDAEISQQVPDQRIAWHATGETKHAGVVTFHPLSDVCTRVTLQMDVEPTDWIEKIGDALGVYEVSVGRDLESFKELIESRGIASGAWRGSIERDGSVSQPPASNFLA